jgi:hypothetical protein
MATGSARGCAALSCAAAPMAAASPFCRPEEDPFLVLEASLCTVPDPPAMPPDRATLWMAASQPALVSWAWRAVVQLSKCLGEDQD